MLRVFMRFSKAPLLVVTALAFVAVGCSPSTKRVHNETENIKINQVEIVKTNYKGPKLRIGVVNFQNNTPRKIRGIEAVATNILSTMLHETGNFIVIPQQDMESILEQQLLGASGAIDSGTAAQMGKILGVNAILSGSITSYSEVVEGSNTLLSQSKTQIAKVGVDYRIVDTTTGIQLFASNGKGEFRKESGGLLGFGSKSSKDTSLKDGALRDALGKAMNNILKQLTGDLWTGRIAEVKGSNVFINAGKQTGLKVGDILIAEELGEEIIDPQSGVSLGRVPGDVIGKLEITGFFGANGSIAHIVSGTKFERNDLVKLE
ncbi:MAG: curli biogenesis system outer membrane secretion channel CsgG [Gammaproteobacteria bacterium]|jgi:curli biogenesis system outer membrane secretion channel CsgG